MSDATTGERAFAVVECPRCDGEGQIQTYNPATFAGRWSHVPAAVEAPCPTCGARMDGAGYTWLCPICATTRDLSRDWHIDRLTDDAYPEGSGKAGALGGECPVCGENSVCGGPDGELGCGSCNGFYAPRFTSEWFAYSDWTSYNDYAVVNPREVDA